MLSKASGAEFWGILQPQVFISNVPKDYLHPADNYLAKEFNAVYPILREKINASCPYEQNFCSRLIDGTSWLDGNEPVYIDFCHITGYGNSIIAKHLLHFVGKN